MTEDEYQRKIDDRFPGEDIEVIGFTDGDSPSKLRCKRCGRAYGFKRAEDAYAKKRTYVCHWCSTEDDRHHGYEDASGDAFQEDDMEVIGFPSIDKPVDELVDSIGNGDDWELLDDAYDVADIDEAPIRRRCRHCGKIDVKSAYDHMHGKGYGELQPKSEEDFIECLPDGYELLSPYRGITKRVRIRHECGFVYATVARNLYLGYGRCPKCKKHGSSGEESIMNILDEYDIDYVREYPLMVNGHRLRVDFKLADYGMFIEYNGIQHYKPIKASGGEEGFRERLYRDRLKKDALGDELYVIRYDEDIRSAIDRIIGSTTIPGGSKGRLGS